MTPGEIDKAQRLINDVRMFEASIDMLATVKLKLVELNEQEMTTRRAWSSLSSGTQIEAINAGREGMIAYMKSCLRNRLATLKALGVDTKGLTRSKYDDEEA